MIKDRAFNRFFHLICFLISTTSIKAWIPCTKNTLPTIRQQVSYPSHLNLRFLERSNDEPSLSLTPDEDKAIREAAKVVSTDDNFGVGWFDRSEAWVKVKEDYPILAQYEDSDLRNVYLKQKPNPLDILTGTPLGPFILVNLLFKYTGFSWCDTPFHAEGACPPL